MHKLMTRRHLTGNNNQMHMHMGRCCTSFTYDSKKASFKVLFVIFNALSSAEIYLEYPQNHRIFWSSSGLNDRLWKTTPLEDTPSLVWESLSTPISTCTIHHCPHSSGYTKRKLTKQRLLETAHFFVHRTYSLFSVNKHVLLTTANKRESPATERYRINEVVVNGVVSGVDVVWHEQPSPSASLLLLLLSPTKILQRFSSRDTWVVGNSLDDDWCRWGHCQHSHPTAYRQRSRLESWKFVGSRYRDTARDDITILWYHITPVCSCCMAADGLI